MQVAAGAMGSPERCIRDLLGWGRVFRPRALLQQSNSAFICEHLRNLKLKWNYKGILFWCKKVFEIYAVFNIFHELFKDPLMRGLHFFWHQINLMLNFPQIFLSVFTCLYTGVSFKISWNKKVLQLKNTENLCCIITIILKQGAEVHTSEMTCLQ